MERGLVHTKKECLKFAWCYFDFEGCYSAIPQKDVSSNDLLNSQCRLFLCLQGPPVVASVSSKRKKGEKNKQKDRSSMGELLVVPFLSKFPIPTDINTSVTKIVNE